MARSRIKATIPTPTYDMVKYGDEVLITYLRRTTPFRGTVLVDPLGLLYILDVEQRTYPLRMTRIRKLWRAGVLIATILEPYPSVEPPAPVAIREHVFALGDLLLVRITGKKDSSDGTFAWDRNITPVVVLRRPHRSKKTLPLHTVHVLRVWRGKTLVASDEARASTPLTTPPRPLPVDTPILVPRVPTPDAFKCEAGDEVEYDDPWHVPAIHLGRGRVSYEGMAQVRVVTADGGYREPLAALVVHRVWRGGEMVASR